MNQTEERRKKLLEATRALYSDKYSNPAIHPRYGRIQTDLGNKSNEQPGTLGVRIVFCLLLFGCYLTMKNTNQTLYTIDCNQIETAVSQNFEWKELLDP